MKILHISLYIASIKLPHLNPYHFEYLNIDIKKIKIVTVIERRKNLAV